MKELTISIPSITCASCAANIKKETDKLESCEVEISVPLKKASVTFDNSKTNEEQILGAFAKAGYKGEVVDD